MDLVFIWYFMLGLILILVGSSSSYLERLPDSRDPFAFRIDQD